MKSALISILFLAQLSALAEPPTKEELKTATRKVILLEREFVDMKIQYSASPYMDYIEGQLIDAKKKLAVLKSQVPPKPCFFKFRK